MCFCLLWRASSGSPQRPGNISRKQSRHLTSMAEPLLLPAGVSCASGCTYLFICCRFLECLPGSRGAFAGLWRSRRLWVARWWEQEVRTSCWNATAEGRVWLLDRREPFRRLRERLHLERRRSVCLPLQEESAHLFLWLSTSPTPANHVWDSGLGMVVQDVAVCTAEQKKNTEKKCLHFGEESAELTGLCNCERDQWWIFPWWMFNPSLAIRQEWRVQQLPRRVELEKFSTFSHEECLPFLNDGNDICWKIKWIQSLFVSPIRPRPTCAWKKLFKQKNPTDFFNQ